MKEKDLQSLFDEARQSSVKRFGYKIYFYVPSFGYYKTSFYSSSRTAFPSVSITGSSCSLMCKHCGGIVLNTMYPAVSPSKLVKLCQELKKNGAVGCLISGGCLPDGSVPLGGYIDALMEIKNTLGLKLVVHTGIVDKELADQLKEVGVDAALIDVIGSDDTIREIYNLDVKVADYERSLECLRRAGIPTAPHVLVGLHYGKLKGELVALEMIKRNNPAAIIVIVFMPIPKTLMEKVKPPAPADVGRILLATRLMMPSVPFALGCMRPKGVHRAKIDVLAIKAGVNAIAFPASEAVKLAKSLGYQISFSSICCSKISQDLKEVKNRKDKWI
jgi:uncharacterized radical SAM superfamily protein